MTTPESPRQPSDKEIFVQALERTTAEDRSAYLDAVCGDDRLLRQRVDELLAHHFDQGSFMADPALNVATALSPKAPVAEGPGSRIGRYKLLQKIGEGGMGVVYMAEQDEPVRRRVALKIIKLGMDTKQVVARFEAERQALALMDHPNIAKVLDAGATDSGRPYFVMELIQGVPISEFCDKNCMSAAERIKLFIPVCQAIQSAHQKGIIHRDIKPSNVLVTLNGGTAVPKVIDFGVAKATNQKLTEKTLFTNYATMIGTPAYMSPEQAEMSSLDIDTRTDVYGLGVLLYELLTGTTPFPEKRLRSVGYGEMQRIILEEEPERPSTRLGTLQGDQRRIVAKNQASTELALGKSFASDLDWIVMKCLEKDRGRRYETANGLAMDLQRHLTNEPVVARPPSAWYRFRKLIQRHRVVFAGGSAVMAAIVGGLGVSLWLLVEEKAALQRAVTAEQAAKREATQREQVARFLGEIVTGGTPEFAKDGDTALLREILGDASERLHSQGASQPSERYNLALAYEGLGDYAKAEALVREALRVVAPNSSSGLDYRKELLDLLFEQQKLEEAEQLLAEALLATPEGLPERINLLTSRGAVLARRGKWKEALADVRIVVALDPANHESHHLLAALLVQDGDAEGYYQHRQSQLNFFAGTEDPVEAERSAKDCLILPLSGAGKDVISEWTDTALAAGTNHWAWSWFELAKGLAEYRHGHFAVATKWMENVLQEAGIDSNRDVEASMVLAMAYHRLGDEAQSKAALVKGKDIARTRLPKQGSADLGAGWVDWIIAHALLREAAMLIGGHSKFEQGTADESESAKEAPK